MNRKQYTYGNDCQILEIVKNCGRRGGGIKKISNQNNRNSNDKSNMNLNINPNPNTNTNANVSNKNQLKNGNT